MSDWGVTRIIVIEVGVYICLIGGGGDTYHCHRGRGVYMSDWGVTRIIVIEVGVYICLIGAQHVPLS